MALGGVEISEGEARAAGGKRVEIPEIRRNVIRNAQHFVVLVAIERAKQAMELFVTRRHVVAEQGADGSTHSRERRFRIRGFAKGQESNCTDAGTPGVSGKRAGEVEDGFRTALLEVNLRRLPQDHAAEPGIIGVSANALLKPGSRTVEIASSDLNVTEKAEPSAHGHRAAATGDSLLHQALRAIKVAFVHCGQRDLGPAVHLLVSHYGLVKAFGKTEEVAAQVKTIPVAGLERGDVAIRVHVSFGETAGQSCGVGQIGRASCR